MAIAILFTALSRRILLLHITHRTDLYVWIGSFILKTFLTYPRKHFLAPLYTHLVTISKDWGVFVPNPFSNCIFIHFHMLTSPLHVVWLFFFSDVLPLLSHLLLETHISNLHFRSHLIMKTISRNKWHSSIHLFHQLSGEQVSFLCLPVCSCRC